VEITWDGKWGSGDIEIKKHVKIGVAGGRELSS
jgi:hypothetical protein